MSNDYTKEIGYEGLLVDFSRYQKQTPKGVGMTRRGRNIYLQFKTANEARKSYACNCSFSLDGMVEALKKSKLVKKQLEELTSEVEFWAWYDKEIKNESQLVDDQKTFEEAIRVVEDDFWNRLSRTKRERSKNNPSDVKSWHRKYGYFYKQLPKEKLVNLPDIMNVIKKQQTGSKNYKEVVGTMKKLVEMNKRKDIWNELDGLDTKQTIFLKLQNINLDEFIKWRNETLGITASLHPNCDLNVRKSWLWVFSTQIIYALRISEVIAIENLLQPYITEDGVPIPALNDPNNTDNLIVVGKYTILGTSTKTGERIARPQIPPSPP